jgi:hypothetical protein
MQLDDKLISMVHSKEIVYEDLTDEKSKTIYLVFIRLSIAVSIVFVTDYVLLFYSKQPIYQTLGIIGGLYNIYNKVESRLAKISLLIAYYIIHKKNPRNYEKNKDAEDCVRIVPVH